MKEYFKTMIIGVRAAAMEYAAETVAIDPFSDDVRILDMVAADYAAGAYATLGPICEEYEWRDLEELIDAQMVQFGLTRIQDGMD